MKPYINIIKILSAAAVLMAAFFVGMVFYFFNNYEANNTDGGCNIVAARSNLGIEPSRHLLSAEDGVEKDYVYMLFSGDMMLDRHVGEKIKSASSSAAGLDNIFGNLASSTDGGFFSGYDLVACNLEGAVTDNGAHYAPANAYDFAFAPELIGGLKKYNFNFFNLANNHFSDQGERGIMETRKNLDALDFDYVGCKDKQTGVCSSKIIEVAGKKIGMAGFSMVYGQFNLQEAEKIVSDLASSTDLVIVNIHWGVEYQHQFNKTQEKIGHALLDAGADIIIGHHPHVAQGMEIYHGKPIFYSLGNFVFDQYFSPDTQEGLAVSIDVDFSKDNDSLQSGSTALIAIGDYGAGASEIAISLFPIKSKASQVELMTGDDKEEFLRKFAGWSKVDEKYKEQINSGRILLKL